MNRIIYLMLILITMAAAQEKEDEGFIDLGESVISATGYKQKLKEAPASISIISKDEILKKPIRDLGDAVQDVPGVNVEGSKTGESQIYMRGLGSSYTLILVDGKRQNVNGSFDANGFGGVHSGFMPPASMIERIEVLRGPASTIYGSDAIGGVINIITKKNPDKITGNFMIETKLQEQHKIWGNMYGANGYLAIPLIENTLSMNVRSKFNFTEQNHIYKPEGLTAASYNHNPYIGHSPSNYMAWNAGSRINWTIDSNNIYLDGEFHHTRSGTLNTSANSIQVMNDFYKTNAILAHNGKYNFGNMDNYFQYTQTTRIPQLRNNDGKPNGNPDKSNLRDNKNYIFSSMLNKDFDFDNYGVLIVNGGLYYMYENFIAKNANTTNKTNNNLLSQHQVAGFSEGQYIINEYVDTTLGLRLNYSNIYKASPNPRFYVNVHPTPYLTLKAGIASGIKIPNIVYLYNGFYNSNTSNATTTDYYGNPSLQAEKSLNYELSAIFDMDPIFLTITGFYTDFKDKVYNETISLNQSIPGGYGNCGINGGNQCNVYKNVDKAMSSGAEVALKMKFIYNITFDTSYAFTYTKQLSGANKGEPIVNIPMHNVSAKLSYVYNDFDVYLRWQGKFKAPTPISGSRGVSTRSVLGKYYKDYQILDLSSSYKFLDYLTLTFSINNLLNTNFVDLVLYNTRGGFNNPDNYVNSYQYYLPGRSYWMSLKVDF